MTDLSRFVSSVLPSTVALLKARRLCTPMLALALALATASVTSAQNPDQPAREGRPTAQSHPNNPELWDVQAMMEDAVKQIARRYNLNDAQENYTRLLLVKNTTAFLEKYEKDIRELLKESIDLRLGIIKGNADLYKRWAERAAPIYEAAKVAILDGNMEWRNVLNDEQKKTHDLDLSLMKSQFEQVSRTLETWKGGGGPTGALAKAANDAARKELGQPQTAVHLNPEDQWLAYVNKFIATYQLDEKQSIAAREKIHKEMRAEAEKYRAKQKKEFDKINDVLKTDARKIKPRELMQRRQELEQPIRDLFVEMHERLMQLANTKQIASADAQMKQQLEALYRTLAGPIQPNRDGKAKPDGKIGPVQKDGKSADNEKEDGKSDKMNKSGQPELKATPVGAADTPGAAPAESRPAPEPTSKPHD